jgi:hypothetical protein
MRRPMLWLTRTRIRLAIAVALGAAVTAAGLALREGHPYGLAVFWWALMLASFTGWGSLVNLWIDRDHRADWGLRAGWGMALFVLVGGYLTAMHLVGRSVLLIQVLLGVGALLAIGVIDGPRGPYGPHWLSRRKLVVAMGRSGTLALVALAYGFAVFTALSFLGEHWFNESDDPPLYFTMAQKLVQTGSIFEPFAGRRVTTLGGHVYLEAAFISMSTPFYMWIVDEGLGVMVTVALLVGHVRRVGLRSRQWVPLGLTLLLFISLVSTRRNTASLFTGVAAIVTLFRTIRVPSGEPADRAAWPMEDRRLIVLGALTCVPILLRTSNAGAVLPFVVLVLASDFLLATRRPWSVRALLSVARTVAILGGVFLLALLPWSVMFAQSCGTPFYPLGHSNLTPGWTFLQKAPDKVTIVKGLVEDLFHGAPLVALIPFFVAGLAPLKGRARNDLVALTVAALVGMVVLARQATAFGPEDMARYYFAYVVAMALLATVTVARTGPGAALVAVCVGMHLAVARDDFHKTLAAEVDRAAKARTQEKERDTFDAVTGDYLDVQSHVPRGVTMVTAVYDNDRFDFTRNRILSLDVLGGMGPKPGWPARRGPEALAQYLVASGVQYVVWVDFDQPGHFYNRARWRDHATREDFKGSYLQGEATVQIDAADAIDKLPTIRRLVYRAHNMSVVDLTAPPAPAGANGT